MQKNTEGIGENNSDKEYFVNIARQNIKKHRNKLDQLLDQITNMYKIVLYIERDLILCPKISLKFFEDTNTFLINSIQYFQNKLMAFQQDNVKPQSLGLENNLSEFIVQRTEKNEYILVRRSQQNMPQFNLQPNIQNETQQLKPQNNNLPAKNEKNTDQFTRKYKTRQDYELTNYEDDEREQKLSYKEFFQIISKDDDQQKLYKCIICPSVIYKNTAHCSQHWNRKHSSNPYKCQNCNGLFPCITDLFLHDFINHSNLHSVDSENIVCEFCGKELKEKTSYKNHIIRKHLDLQLQDQIEDFKKIYYKNAYKKQIQNNKD